MENGYFGQILFALADSSQFYFSSFEGNWSTLSIQNEVNDTSKHIYTTSSLSSSIALMESAAASQSLLFQGAFGTSHPSYLTSYYISFGIGDNGSNQLDGYAFVTSVLRGKYDWMSRWNFGKWFEPGTTYEDGYTLTTGLYRFQVSDDWNSVIGYYQDVYTDGNISEGETCIIFKKCYMIFIYVHILQNFSGVILEETHSNHKAKL